MPPLTKSLSARLLLATIAFILLAEILIFAPSVGRFRKGYLDDRINDAHLATLVLSATDEYMLTDAVRQRLLGAVGAHGIVASGGGYRRLVLARDMPPAADVTIDLAETGMAEQVIDAFGVFTRGDDRILRVIGPAPDNSGLVMEVVIDERPLRLALADFARRIAGLSIIISFFTAGLVFAVLQGFFVRPLRRTTESMVAFRANPEDPRLIIAPSGRADEIGIAQRELARMQRQIGAALSQKARLATLGTAVTKINHDLRNILATAGIVSENLAGSEHPEVRRAAGRLVAAIDRAAGLCSQTLDYARSGAMSLTRARFHLDALVAETGLEFKAVVAGDVGWRNDVPTALTIEADRDQLFRVLTNLARNAIEAGARVITVSARAEAGVTVVEMGDDGPGLPDAIRARLFQPFAGGGRAGGTGLGLAIAREIVHAHGGELTLASSAPTGTVFRLVLPAGADPGD